MLNRWKRSKYRWKVYQVIHKTLGYTLKSKDSFFLLEQHIIGTRLSCTFFYSHPFECSVLLFQPNSLLSVLNHRLILCLFLLSFFLVLLHISIYIDVSGEDIKRNNLFCIKKLFHFICLNSKINIGWRSGIWTMGF